MVAILSPGNDKHTDRSLCRPVKTVPNRVGTNWEGTRVNECDNAIRGLPYRPTVYTYLRYIITEMVTRHAHLELIGQKNVNE